MSSTHVIYQLDDLTDDYKLFELTTHPLLFLLFPKNVPIDKSSVLVMLLENTTH